MSSKINIVISAEDKASEPIRRVKGATDDLSDSSGKFSKVYSAVAKTSAVVAGAAAAAAGKFVLWNGAMRALNIEDAQAKLRGLGHDGESVGRIMDSALASVKGTAFGLDAAATAAAGAVAAGVKPGKDLTRYLSLAGDAATIAGVSFSEMGSIFGKVQTNQKAYTEELNQLADRGIPIYQWLQEELGVSAAALRKMVAEGKVDSETYFKVIQKNIGGAALESGSTTRGAWANLKAAMSRVGADIAKDIIPQVRDAMGDATKFIDENSKTAVDAVKSVRDKFGELAVGAGEVAKQVGSYLGPKFEGLWKVIQNDLAPSLHKLWVEVLQPLIPVVGQSLVVALGLATDTVKVFFQVLSPIISFLGDNEWIIWGVVGAFGAFKTAMFIEDKANKFKEAIQLMTGGQGLGGLISNLDTARGKFNTPMIMAAIGVGAALAALQLVIDKFNQTKAVIEETKTSFQNSQRESEKTNSAMKKAADEGKITQEAYQKYLTATADTAAESAASVKNQYSGVFGWINKNLDKAMGSPAYAAYEQAMKKGGGGGGGGGFSSGGYTGAGGKYEYAGPVHRGEFVVDRDNVDQSTGLPKPGAFGGGHTVVIQNMNINNGGDYNRMLSDIGFALETA